MRPLWKGSLAGLVVAVAIIGVPVAMYLALGGSMSPGDALLATFLFMLFVCFGVIFGITAE